MTIITYFIQALLGSALLVQAAIAAFQPKKFVQFVAILPGKILRRVSFISVTLLAGIATLIGAVVPFVAFFASCLALFTALFLVGLIIRAKTTRYWPFPLVLIVASLGVAISQPLGLKVTALPKADELPYLPVQARVVKTYDEGVWFEGISAGPDGTLYLAANRNLDFSRGDYYRQALGEIIARKPSGEERSIFKTPIGEAAGVIAVGSDGTLYMTSNSYAPSIWRISPNGTSEMITRLPRGAWPNGLDFGPDGMLYSPDSKLGLIWRIDPKTGLASKALTDDRLLARPLISLAPGANGLHFKGRNMIVTVSDKTTILNYTLMEDGSFAPPSLLASGIPGDDFAISNDGSLFITTHPYNTLVRVSPTGKRTIIGKEKQNIVGATDAVFGRGANDGNTLYVVTDGGAFTGGSKTRGQLIALKPYQGP